MMSQRETQASLDRERSEQQAVGRPVLPAQDARQAATGHNARYVLGFSVAAIVILFIILWLVYFG